MARTLTCSPILCNVRSTYRHQVAKILKDIFYGEHDTLVDEEILTMLRDSVLEKLDGKHFNYYDGCGPEVDLVFHCWMKNNFLLHISDGHIDAIHSIQNIRVGDVTCFMFLQNNWLYIYFYFKK